MGRTVTFMGQELSVPGPYSYTDISRLLQPSSSGIGIVALVGEAEGGKPGLHVFPGGTSPAVVRKALRRGPGADMVRLALRATAADPLVPGGASTVIFFKTNESTQASLSVGKLTLHTKQYGSKMSLYAANLASTSRGTVLTVRDEKGVPEQSAACGVLPYLSVRYTGNATSAKAKLSFMGEDLVFATALEGQTDDSDALSITVPAGMTLKQLAQQISMRVGYESSVKNSKDSFRVSDLDLVVAETDLKAGLDLKAGIFELVKWSEDVSELVDVIRTPGNDGDKLPDGLADSAFTGGADGTTTNSRVQEAFNALLNFRVNVSVPLFCEDAQDGSTVTIQSVNSILKDHVESRSSLLGRSEAQGYVAIKGNKETYLAECLRINSKRVAVTSETVTDLDIEGNVREFPEYGFAVVCAQIQAGSPVGTPLDNRALPVSGVKAHSSWDPIRDAATMIKGGCLFAAPDEKNVWRIVGGYESWQGDENNANIFIEMVESLDVFAFNHRNFMRTKFQGVSRFTRRDVLDAIEESQAAEVANGTIKGYDSKLTSLESVTAGKLVYDLAVEPWEGVRFILPTIIAIREA